MVKDYTIIVFLPNFFWIMNSWFSEMQLSQVSIQLFNYFKNGFYGTKFQGLSWRCGLIGFLRASLSFTDSWHEVYDLWVMFTKSMQRTGIPESSFGSKRSNFSSWDLPGHCWSHLDNCKWLSKILWNNRENNFNKL